MTLDNVFSYDFVKKLEKLFSFSRSLKKHNLGSKFVLLARFLKSYNFVCNYPILRGDLSVCAVIYLIDLAIEDGKMKI